jgi:hypothetical protein
MVVAGTGNEVIGLWVCWCVVQRRCRHERCSNTLSHVLCRLSPTTTAITHDGYDQLNRRFRQRLEYTLEIIHGIITYR